MLNYQKDSKGIYKSTGTVLHREDEYPEAGFETLAKMQQDHFWYLGRHKFVLYAVSRFVQSSPKGTSAIDLGGGTGGWVQYLADQQPSLYSSLAIGDSSSVALSWAQKNLPEGVDHYQIDLMDPKMHHQWDSVFLLDVLEHLPDDQGAMIQMADALKPGGYAFVTTPAFQQFWSYNDDLACHLRRYRRSDFTRLAEKSGLELCDSRYFMFFLSPLYLLSRFKPWAGKLTEKEKLDMVKQQHEIPPAWINKILAIIFNAESLLGHWLNFPWGTSVLAVFRKPL